MEGNEDRRVMSRGVASQRVSRDFWATLATANDNNTNSRLVCLQHSPLEASVDVVAHQQYATELLERDHLHLVAAVDREPFQQRLGIDGVDRH